MDIDYSKYFPIREYYEKVVMPISKRFRVTKGDKFICCLHDDTDPSMGIIHSKKKGEIFHCFGCNSYGTIIDLHKRVSLKYFGKRLDDDLAKRELCNIFNISYKDLPKEDDYVLEKSDDKDIKKEYAMREALKRYDISDLKNDFVAGKMEGKGVPYFNTLIIRVIDEMNKRQED